MRDKLVDLKRQIKNMKDSNPAASAQFSALADREADVIKLMESKHALVKTVVEAALVRIDAAARGPLVTAAQSSHWDTRTSAARVLQMLGQPVG
jgi:hypothetical protein